MVGEMWFGALSRALQGAAQLMDAVVECRGGEVGLLLSRGARADLVVPERGAAALHLLAGLQGERWAADVTLRALRSGADPDVRSEEGLTPLHVAATYGRCLILEVLLTNGANPFLLDYRLLQDAGGLAYKEKQWKAYTMLTTYSVIVENEERFSKYLEDGSSNDEKIRNNFNRDPLLNKTESRFKNCSVNTSESISDGELYENGTEDCEWLKNTFEGITLDNNAVNIIKDHRRKTETYQYPLLLEEASVINTDMKLADTFGTEFRHDFPSPKCLQSNPCFRSLRKQLENKDNHDEDSKVNDASSNFNINITTESSSKIFTQKNHEVKSVMTDKRSASLREDEMYIYGFSESSFKSRNSREKAGIPTNCTDSKLESSERLSNNMLCKMSRIFLVMLKKRHCNMNQFQEL